MAAATGGAPSGGAALRRRRTAAQLFCLVGGAILLLRGAVGLALDPEFGVPGEGWHQLIHFGSGAVLLLAARTTAATAVALALGLGYTAAAVAGAVDGQDVGGLVAVETGDNALHTVIAVTALGAAIATLAARRR